MSGYSRLLRHYFRGLCLISLIPTLVMATSPVEDSPEVPDPSIIVLYKDSSGTFEHRTDDSGQLHIELSSAIAQKLATLDITASQQDQVIASSTAILDNSPFRLSLPLGLDKGDTPYSTDWNLQHKKTNRSWAEYGARVLIPLAGAAVAMGSLTDGTGMSWRHPHTNTRGNAGHLMVMATVNNLVEELGEGMTSLLDQYSIPGLGKIPAEWQSRGVMAIMVLSYAGTKATGAPNDEHKDNLSMYEASKFFTQSRVVAHSNLLLGEASGQLIDSVSDLAPEYRKILTSAFGGFSTGSLYYLLSSLVGKDNLTSDFEGKISNATVFGINRALLPFVDSYMGQWTDNKLTRHLSSNLVMAGFSLSASAPLYYLVGNYGTKGNKANILGKFAAGSLAKFVGASLGQVFGPKTMREYFGNQAITPVAIAASALSVGFLTHKLYTTVGAPRGTSSLIEGSLYKFRDGLFASLVTGGITATIEEVVRWSQPQAQKVKLNLRLSPINEDEAVEEYSPDSLEHTEL